MLSIQTFSMTAGQPLLDLPPEILGRVFSFLDLKSCVSASGTCRILQPYAESRIYSHIDSVPRARHDYLVTKTTEDIQRQAEKNLAAVDDLDDQWFFEEADFLTAQYATQSELDIALSALQHNPSRASMVRRVRVYVIEGILDTTVKLLRIVKDHVESLEVVVHEEVSFASSSAGLAMFDVMSGFYDDLHVIGTFPKLRTFVGKVNSADLKDIKHVLHLSSTLRFLELDIAQGYEGSADDDLSLGSIIDAESLQHIEVLRVVDMEAHFMSFITEMIVRMPRLRSLAINSLFDQGETIPLKDAFILRGKPGLRYLEWVDGSRRIPKVSDGTELLSKGFAEVEVLLQGCAVNSSLRINSPFGVGLIGIFHLCVTDVPARPDTHLTFTSTCSVSSSSTSVQSPEFRLDSINRRGRALDEWG